MALCQILQLVLENVSIIQVMPFYVLELVAQHFGYYIGGHHHHHAGVTKIWKGIARQTMNLPISSYWNL